MEQVTMKDRNERQLATKNEKDFKQLDIEEFSIVELEDRLEFLDRCDGNCSCC